MPSLGTFFLLSSFVVAAYAFAASIADRGGWSRAESARSIWSPR